MKNVGGLDRGLRIIVGLVLIALAWANERLTNQSLKDANKENIAATAFTNKNLRNAEAGDRVFALAKSVASLKYLGINPRSALVNLTSMATSVARATQAVGLAASSNRYSMNQS